MKIETVNTDFNIHDSNYIAFINGQYGLHETEAMLFKKLATHNFTNIISLDDLFKFPERIKVLKIMNIDTIVVGTTGIYRDDFDKVFDVFKALNYLPKTALVTMGEDYFYEYKDKVEILSLMPITYSTDEIVIWNKNK